MSIKDQLARKLERKINSAGTCVDIYIIIVIKIGPVNRTGLSKMQVVALKSVEKGRVTGHVGRVLNEH